MLRCLLLAGCCGALPLLAGCDPLAAVIGIDAFDVSLGDDAVFLLIPSTTLSAATRVEIEADLPDVFDVESISIPRSGVAYHPAVSGGSGARCDVRLYVVIDGAPALQSTVTVDESEVEPVQRVTSRYAQPYDRDALCEGLPDCPVSNRDLTEAQIRDRVDDAVDRGSFEIDFIAANDGPCTGVLRIEALHFELDF